MYDIIFVLLLETVRHTFDNLFWDRINQLVLIKSWLPLLPEKCHSLHIYSGGFQCLYLASSKTIPNQLPTLCRFHAFLASPALLVHLFCLFKTQKLNIYKKCVYLYSNHYLWVSSRIKLPTIPQWAPNELWFTSIIKLLTHLGSLMNDFL